jgi:periplasmic divalent cation tolerance protein
MSKTERLVLIYTTFAALDDAKRVGRALVEGRLAACVNIFPGMVSIFEWQGVLDETQEVAMIIKTREGLVAPLLAETERLHPYEVPALLVIPIEAAGEAYRDWVLKQTVPGPIGGKSHG